jgi:hypothetical protein
VCDHERCRLWHRRCELCRGEWREHCQQAACGGCAALAGTLCHVALPTGAQVLEPGYGRVLTVVAALDARAYRLSDGRDGPAITAPFTAVERWRVWRPR